MQSKIVGIAKRIAARDKPVFDSLVDFEKSGRIRSKARMNFTIDKSLALQFKRFCEEKGYNMSAKVEQAMKAYMSQKE